MYTYIYFRQTETPNYVLHPVNAYHLLKRTAKWIPKLMKNLPNFKFAFNVPSISDAYVGAALGLADIHEHFNLETNDLAKGEFEKITVYSDPNLKIPFQNPKGVIKDALNGLTYKSNSPLTSQELLGIASEAKSMTYLEGEVNWLMAALKQAKFEKLSAKAISSIK